MINFVYYPCNYFFLLRIVNLRCTKSKKLLVMHCHRHLYLTCTQAGKFIPIIKLIKKNQIPGSVFLFQRPTRTCCEHMSATGIRKCP